MHFVAFGQYEGSNSLSPFGGSELASWVAAAAVPSLFVVAGRSGGFVRGSPFPCETDFDARTVQEPVVSGRVLFAPSFLPSLLLFLPLLVLGVFSSAQTFPQHKPPSQDVVLKRFS